MKYTEPELMERAAEAVVAASELLSGGAIHEIRSKSPTDFVTDVDFAVQERLKRELGELAPEVQFMGEEQDNSAIDPARPFWVLDPVDGTTNLIRGLGRSAVSLALCLGDGALFGVVRNPFRQYLPNTQLLHLLQGLERTDPRRQEEREAPGEAAAGQTAGALDSLPQSATGVETVILGVSPKVGRSYFSHEFIHGLGAGNLCVAVAVENTESVGRNETLIFGDGVFTAEEFSLAAPACAVGAMVNVKKGTLQLGLKLLEKTGQQSIRLRWWAWRNPEEQAEKEELADAVQVVITPNTANLEPLQQVRFTAMVEGSASQEVNWSVVEKNGGSIDRNGLYTAPSTEGVFEIRAQSAKYGNYKASAYVVVSKL